MCIDFTDQNKYCPKDCPQPVIDIIVEAVSGYEVLFFLDAYKGYHQIMMDEQDAQKTAFITDLGVFCYQKMPFGLKNAGATGWLINCLQSKLAVTWKCMWMIWW